MSNQERLIWLDGELIKSSEAKISVFDHGLLYGDGIFEGIRFYAGKVFRLEEHIQRLFASAKAILLTMPWSEQEVCDIVCQTVRANGLTDGYIRLVLTRGVGGLGLNPYLCKKPSMFCIADSIQLYPESYYTDGLELVTCSTRRPSHATLSPQVKSLNYLNNVMAKIECLKAGVVEGLMLNEEGLVAECTGDTIFLVKNGTVVTPKITDGALDGITRFVVFDLCESLDIPVIEDQVTRYDIYTAEECFLTGTAAEVIAVNKLDDRVIGTGKPGEIFVKLLEAFRHEVVTTGTPVYQV